MSSETTNVNNNNRKIHLRGLKINIQKDLLTSLRNDDALLVCFVAMRVCVCVCV